MLHSVGKTQKLGIDTHILFADPSLAHISSTAVKEVAKHSGDIHELVPLHVKQAIEEKICQQYIIGLTGEIGCGKSHLGAELARIYCKDVCCKTVHNIELDHIGQNYN